MGLFESGELVDHKFTSQIAIQLLQVNLTLGSDALAFEGQR